MRQATVHPRLLVVAGPIAGGKSTLAGAIGERLRAGGHTVAIVGLDEVAAMALPALPDWHWAHEAHARLVAAWLATPIDLVVAEGPGTPAELDCLMKQAPGTVRSATVLLTSSYAVAQQRASADPTREVSKEPRFLRRHYERFEQVREAIPRDLTIDTGVHDLEACTDHVMRHIVPTSGGAPLIDS